jgi:hypothetical protein
MAPLDAGEDKMFTEKQISINCAYKFEVALKYALVMLVPRKLQ